jgi:hypothetical protein
MSTGWVRIGHQAIPVSGLLLVAAGTSHAPLPIKKKDALQLQLTLTDSGFTRLDKGCVSNFRTPVTGFYPKQDLTTSADIDGVYTYTSNDLEYRDNHTVISSGTMMMDKMHVYWEESDLSKFDRDYASSLADVLLESNTFTPTATTAAADISATAADVASETASPPNRSLPLTPATSSAVLDPTTEPDAASSSSGLSTGVKAGISVGAAVGAILVFFAGFLLYKKRLAKKARLDRETAKQNDQPEFVPVREEEDAFTLPNSEARWSRFLAGQ